MAERQQNLGRTSENRPEQVGVVADRLVLAHSARQDFARATQLADALAPDLKLGPHIYVHIGEEQALSGLDYQSTVARLINLSSQPGQVYGGLIREGVIRIHLAAGDFDSVEQELTAADPRLSERPEFNLNLARAKAKFGQDPRPTLTQPADRARRYDEEGWNASDSYAELAVVHFQTTGEYPAAYLEAGVANLERYAATYHREIHLPGWWATMARAYASCGNFEAALQLVARVQPVTTEEGYKQSEGIDKFMTFQHIAQEQLDRGLYPDAIQSALQAISQVNLVQDPQKDMYQTVESAELYALIAKAQGLSGDDPSGAFESAMERVDAIPFNAYWKMYALIEIAKAQVAVSIDPKPTLDLALQGLDAMPQAENYDDYYDYTQQIMGYEELIKVQAELGFIDAARTTLSRLEGLPQDDYNVQETIVDSLVVIAGVQARKALKQQEIESLSPEDIQTILATDNESVKQALEYFGLLVA